MMPADLSILLFSGEPVVDVDQAGDATEVLPAIQATLDAQVGHVEHTCGPAVTAAKTAGCRHHPRHTTTTATGDPA